MLRGYDPPRKSKVPICSATGRCGFFIAVAKTGSFSAAGDPAQHQEDDGAAAHQAHRAPSSAPSCSTATATALEMTPAARGCAQSRPNRCWRNATRSALGRPRPRDGGRWCAWRRPKVSRRNGSCPRLSPSSGGVIPTCRAGDRGRPGCSLSFPCPTLATSQADIANPVLTADLQPARGDCPGRQFKHVDLRIAPATSSSSACAGARRFCRENHIVDNTTPHSRPGDEACGGEGSSSAAPSRLRTNSRTSAMKRV